MTSLPFIHEMIADTGVVNLVERLLDGLKPLIVPRLADPEGKGTYRVIISTPLAESAVAPYLTQLAATVEPHGVKVGSYPRWGKKRNTVTLVGRQASAPRAHCKARNFSNTSSRDRAYLESLVAEVEEGVQGRRVTVEGEDDSGAESGA